MSRPFVTFQLSSVKSTCDQIIIRHRISAKMTTRRQHDCGLQFCAAAKTHRMMWPLFIWMSDMWNWGAEKSGAIISQTTKPLRKSQSHSTLNRLNSDWLTDKTSPLTVSERPTDNTRGTTAVSLEPKYLLRYLNYNSPEIHPYKKRDQIQL